MPGKLIIIDGNDSSGKATQTKKLVERLEQEHYDVRKVEFPNYDSPSSALVKMYLNGSFGHEPEDVNPYVASTFYAVDRFASFRTDWGNFYQAGGIIVADRYTTSNMIHQAVKITNETARKKYLDWLWDLEFVKFSLPVPDCVLFLDMPPAYSAKLMAERPLKSGEKQDIHEQNQQYLLHCYDYSRWVAEQYGWMRIECAQSGKVKNIGVIHEEVYSVVKKLL